LGKRAKGTNLQSANQCIIYFLLEKFPSLVVNTRPTPDVLVVAVGFGSLENTGCNSPHDGAKNEVSDCEQSVVNGHLLSSLVTASPVVPEYNKT
jgi:hypothetical protein